MQGRYNHLLFIILAITVTGLWFGCTQPDDVMAPISQTQLTLSPDRLPTLPDSLVYYFWAIDSASNDPHAYRIGSFIWSSELYKFYDLDTNEIDSVWDINYDVLDPFYKYVVLTVEKMGELPVDSVLPVDSIGPIMLKDTLIDPAQSPVKMVFPLDLWLGNGFFCVETPTDGNSNSNDVSGLWFTEYIYDRIKYADTFNVRFRFVAGRDTISREIVIDTLTSDTTFWNCNQYQFGNCIDSTEVTDTSLGYDFIGIYVDSADSFAVFYPEGYEGEPDTLGIAALSETMDTLGITRKHRVVDSNYTLVDTLVIDSFVHTRIEFNYVVLPVNITGEIKDTVVTLYRLNADSSDFIEYDSTFRIYPLVDYNSEMIYAPYVDSQYILVDKFLQSYEEVPDLYGTKWHYKGWVLSPFLQPRSSFGTLDKPVWNEFYISQELTPVDGGLITTGSFKSFRGRDDSNPYSENKRVPNVPGEDFLVNLPAGVDSIYLCVPNVDSTGSGTVFITVEPDNYGNDWKNFPMVYMDSRMPPYYMVTRTGEHSQFLLGDPTFNMTNMFSTVDGNPVGFPAVHVKIVSE